MNKKILGDFVSRALWIWSLIIGIYVNVMRFSGLAVGPRISQSLVIIQDSFLILVFLFRNPSRKTSWNFFDVIFSFVGSFAPFLFIPANQNDPSTLGLGLQIIGICLAIFSILSLNRSFGVLPANRGVQTQGMYRVVRHPIYVSYQISHLGYTIDQFSVYNVTVATICLLSQVLRIFAEEKLLSQDPKYMAYRSQVRWRLIPFIF